MFADLQAQLPPDRTLTAPEDLMVYGQDGTWLFGRPDLVVFPHTTEEVVTVVRWAGRRGVPIIPRGAATGLSGGTVPEDGGIVLNLVQMDRILQVDTGNQFAVVQPGVVNADLQAAVEPHGLFFPPDPSSWTASTLGGNIATNAGGPRCLKYGVTRDYVLGLAVVLADGKVRRLGPWGRGDGLDSSLMDLIIGSEGTLAVVVEAMVRLLPKPPAQATVLAIYNEITDAAQAVNAVLEAGIVPLTSELMDGSAIRAVEDYLRLGLPRDADALILIAVNGEEVEVDVLSRQVEAICREKGARTVARATTPEEDAGLWKARRSISGATGRIGRNKLGEDICVPRSQVPVMVQRIRAIAAEQRLPIVLFGHIGDGNLHPNFIFDLRDQDQVQRMWRGMESIIMAALELGGTISGEHGIGLLKRPFLPRALDPAALAKMRAIRRRFDPQGVMNRGKVFDGNE